MQKQAGGKQALIGLLLTVAGEGAFLLLFGWGGAAGWIDGEKLLWPTLIAASAAASIGALYLVRKKWGVIPAALLSGIVVQLVILLAGYLVFGPTSFGGGRWWTPAAAFLTALIAGLFASGKRGGRKKKLKRRH